jgi:hypothetical protein
MSQRIVRGQVCLARSLVIHARHRGRIRQGFTGERNVAYLSLQCLAEMRTADEYSNPSSHERQPQASSDAGQPLGAAGGRYRAALDSRDAEVLFVAGCEENQVRFQPRFRTAHGDRREHLRKRTIVSLCPLATSGHRAVPRRGSADGTAGAVRHDHAPPVNRAGRRGDGRIGPADRSDPGQDLVPVLQGADHPRPPGDWLAGQLGCGHVQSPFLSG